ncbi:MAG TPA: SMC-Scp complex subunit ScpB, partial [Tepidisphaeraceae bacterium]
MQQIDPSSEPAEALIVSLPVAEAGEVEVDDGPVVDAGSVEHETAAAVVDVPTLEAVLFSTHHPLTAGRLAEILAVEQTKSVRHAIGQLNQQYEATGRSFRVEQVAGGYQLLTLPIFAAVIKKHQQKEADAKLTKAAMETLAIIA